MGTARWTRLDVMELEPALNGVFAHTEPDCDLALAQALSQVEISQHGSFGGIAEPGGQLVPIMSAFGIGLHL